MAAEQANVPSAGRLKRLPRVLTIGILALFLGLLAYGVAKKSPDDTIDNQLSKGQSAKAPGFSLELLTAGRSSGRLREALAGASANGKVDFDRLRDTPVVLNYWASWCDPCASEASTLEAGWRRWGKRNVLFLGLDMQDLREDARQFLSDHRVSYPAVRDPGKKTAKRYGATGIPETYFISASGRVVAHVVGAVSRGQLEDGVAAALSGNPVGKTRGGARRPPR